MHGRDAKTGKHRNEHEGTADVAGNGHRRLLMEALDEADIMAFADAARWESWLADHERKPCARVNR